MPLSNQQQTSYPKDFLQNNLKNILNESGSFFDSRGNKDFQCLPTFWNSPLLQPFLDQQVNKASITWPQNRPFAACLTHDVDHISLHSFSEHRRRFNDWKHFKRRRAKLSVIKKSVTGMTRALFDRVRHLDDPFWTFEKWLELESQYDAKSTFFFFPSQPSQYHFKDCRYQFKDKLRFRNSLISVSDLIKSLSSLGWDIGLHGSYHSFDNAHELMKQKQQLEEVLQNKIVCNRQHTLHFDVHNTPLALEKAGFKFDSSLGFNRIVGFRFGTSFPFHYPENKKDQYHSLIQIPLHIQDSSLFRKDNMDLDEEGAFFYCKLLIDRVKTVGGVITLSWHHGTYDQNTYPGWFEVYKQCLTYLKENQAWITSMREIGEWFQQQKKR